MAATDLTGAGSAARDGPMFPPPLFPPCYFWPSARRAAFGVWPEWEVERPALRRAGRWRGRYSRGAIRAGS